MRLLRLIATMDPRSGGPLAAAVAVTPFLDALGVSTEFLSLDPSSTPAPAGLPDSTIHNLGPKLPGFSALAYGTRSASWLEANAARFDLLIVHGLWQHHGLLAHRCKRKRGTPYCVYPHGMLDPALRRLYPFRHLKKWLFWKLFQATILRDATAVFFTCEEERLRARDVFRPYACTEMVLNYGASPPPQDSEKSVAGFRDKACLGTDEPYLLFLSRLHNKKGLEALLRAYAKQRARVPGTPRLVLAGPQVSSEYQRRLEELAESTGASPGLLWPGMLEGDWKWGALHGAEALILPSHQENFGLVLAEALACGTPVLISDKVNISGDIARDGSGLVAPDSDSGILSLLERWHTLPKTERLAMRQRALQTYLSRYDIRTTAENLHQVLSQLKNTPHTPSSHA